MSKTDLLVYLGEKDYGQGQNSDSEKISVFMDLFRQPQDSIKLHGAQNQYAQQYRLPVLLPGRESGPRMKANLTMGIAL